LAVVVQRLEIYSKSVIRSSQKRKAIRYALEESRGPGGGTLCNPPLLQLQVKSIWFKQTIVAGVGCGGNVLQIVFTGVT
jgi:hypothetical protein